MARAPEVRTLDKRIARLERELLVLRFWARVTRGDGCWEWTGFTDKYGYGQYQRNIKAHRFAYETTKGPVPKGMLVLHSCDNRKCCRPAHLRPGTRLDNFEDMVSRGRSDPWGHRKKGGV